MTTPAIGAASYTPASARMQRLTPVLIVDRIEPCLAFWRDRLEFTVTVEIPHEDHLGFAILEKDAVQVMYQSRASVAADVPGMANDAPGFSAGLFIEVSDADAVERALAGVPLVMPRRKTFYGMDEIIVREPGGSVVTFAQQVGGDV